MKPNSARRIVEDTLAWEAEQIRSAGQKCFGSYPGHSRPVECQECGRKIHVFGNRSASKTLFNFSENRTDDGGVLVQTRQASKGLFKDTLKVVSVDYSESRYKRLSQESASSLSFASGTERTKCLSCPTIQSWGAKLTAEKEVQNDVQIHKISRDVYQESSSHKGL